MTLIAGVDSSTQSCKVVVCDAETGRIIRSGRAAHPAGTEVDPEAWWEALQEAIAAAGGLDDVEAVSIGGQQHGCVILDADGAVIRPALLWNDTRSAPDAERLIDERGDEGAAWWAEAVGLVPVASFTVTKLAWIARNEPENAARIAAVCLPHDWLTWRLAGHGIGNADLAALTTDRSDASGTGYYDAEGGDYRYDILESILDRRPIVPRVLGPLESAGTTPSGAKIGPGAGDNAAAALGIGARAGDLVVSVGTSGTVFAVSDTPTRDASGLVAGFADATGGYLPLACTLNASLVLDATARLLGVDPVAFDELALSGDADGLQLVPYLAGERTPNLPDSTGTLLGITLANLTPPALARAAVEGVVCSLADACTAVERAGVRGSRALFVGGGARYRALQQVAGEVFSLPVAFPEPAEYVALGMARQAAGVLAGALPQWSADAEAQEQGGHDTAPLLTSYRHATALLWGEAAIS
ncbi:MAG: xylulokinase [Microbacterium sp.]|uniref:xylulokinase n=1 Tax=Microbacterium sp. TaxID=51671 RepID=UPI003F95B53A